MSTQTDKDGSKTNTSEGGQNRQRIEVASEYF